MKMFKQFIREQEGQDAIEYGLLAGFISLSIAAAVTVIGTDLKALFEAVGKETTKAKTGV